MVANYIRWEVQLCAFRLWMKIERMEENRLIKKIVLNLGRQ